MENNNLEVSTLAEARAISKFSYEPTNGLLDRNRFPTQPNSEEDARGQFMTLFNQIKDYNNNVLYPEISDHTTKLNDLLSKLGSDIGTNEGTVDLPGITIKWGTFKGSGAYTFATPFKNNCIIVISSPMVAHTSEPPYSVLSGIAGGWDKTKFNHVTYGYDIVGTNGQAIGDLAYKNTVSSANFQGVSRWIALGN